MTDSDAHDLAVDAEDEDEDDRRLARERLAADSGKRYSTADVAAAAGAATWGAFRDALSDWTPPDDPTIDADVRGAREAVTLDDDGGTHSAR